jgi:hypothetical protein
VRTPEKRTDEGARNARTVVDTSTPPLLSGSGFTDHTYADKDGQDN